MPTDVERAKRRAGESAAELAEDGDVVGLGTGSTAAYAIRRLGKRIDGGLDVRGVPTSHGARALAVEAGVPLTDLNEATPDIAIDGADQLADGDCVKGGGAAHAREKVVDAAADRLVLVVDDRKLTDMLHHPVPVEVLADAVPTVRAAVREADAEPTLRAAERKDGPVVTDNGNLVVDCAFGAIEAPGELAARLSELPGVVEHGLFVGLADEAHIGSDDGVRRRRYG